MARAADLLAQADVLNAAILTLAEALVRQTGATEEQVEQFMVARRRKLDEVRARTNEVLAQITSSASGTRQ